MLDFIMGTPNTQNGKNRGTTIAIKPILKYCT